MLTGEVNLYKRGRGFEFGTIENKSSQHVRAGVQLGAFEIQVRGSNSSEWENYSLVSDMSLEDYTKIC